MRSFQIRHSSKSSCVVYVLVRHADTGADEDVCHPQTDHGFSMFRKIMTYQLESGHVIGQS